MMSAPGPKPWLPEAPIPPHALSPTTQPTDEAPQSSARVGTCETCGRKKVMVTASPGSRCVDRQKCVDRLRRNANPGYVDSASYVTMSRKGRAHFYLRRVVIEGADSRGRKTSSTHYELVPDQREATVFPPEVAMKLAAEWGGTARETNGFRK